LPSGFSGLNTVILICGWFSSPLPNGTQFGIKNGNKLFFSAKQAFIRVRSIIFELPVSLNMPMNPMKTKLIVFLLLFVLFSFPLYSQLKLGNSQSEINFREGPGVNSRVLSSVGSSNLLVILPGELQNGFAQVFDIESSSFGFVYERLIKITDTLNFQKQHFFERSGENINGDIEIELINRTDKSLFVWINKNIFNLAPHEKKNLIFNDEEITYFSSAPGLYPVFGKEILKKGNSYKWNFTL
jgi:hypothetical protein